MQPVTPARRNSTTRLTSPDPESKGSPWNGVVKTIVQPVPDGLFYRMHLAEQRDYELAHYGRFCILERPHKMQYTWVSQHTLGLESLVTLRFDPRGDATHLTLVHENLPDDDMGRRHQRGWTRYLDLLGESMANKARR